MSKTIFSKPSWYELIDPLKNLRSTLVPGTKELSLVILGITKLCLLYLFVYFFFLFVFVCMCFCVCVFLCVCVSVCVCFCVWVCFCVCVCVEEPAPRHSRHLCIQDAAAAAYRMLLLLSFAYRTTDTCVEEPSQFILLLRLYEPALHVIERMLLLSCGHYASEIHCN